MEKLLIYDLDLPELSTKIQEWGEPNYRAEQIWQGLYRSLWNAPDQFSNLPQTLRQKLEQEFCFSGLTPISVLNSLDGETQKTLFYLQMIIRS